MEILGAILAIFFVAALVLLLVLTIRASDSVMRTPPRLDGLPHSHSNFTEHLAKEFYALLGSLGRAAGKTTGSVANNARQAYQASNPTSPDDSDLHTDHLAKYNTLEKLRSLLDNGTISQDEFEAEKRKILK